MGKKFEDKLIVYQYKELFVMGVTGNMENSLSYVAPMIIQRHRDIEVAPVQRQSGRDFLAMFVNKPPMDITIDQISQSENAIVGYSLNKKKLTETIEQIAKTVGFASHSVLNSETANVWGTEFELEKITYVCCEKISSALQKPLESVFGMLKYTNFMKRYKGVEEEKATKISALKFGIPILPQ